VAEGRHVRGAVEAWVRKAEGIDEGEPIEVDLVVTPANPR